MVNVFAQDGLSPICAAFEAMDTLLIHFLLSEGARLNRWHIDACTPSVLLARLEDGIPLMQFLISQGIDINEEDGKGRFPLEQAVRSDKEPMVTFLLENGASLGQRRYDGTGVIASGIEGFASTSLLESLVLAGADAHDITTKGVTLLMHACRVADDAEFVRSLVLEHGFEVNTVDENGMNALQYVFYRKDRMCMWLGNQAASVVEFLLEQGANPSLITDSGESVLHSLLARCSSMYDYLTLQRESFLSELFKSELLRSYEMNPYPSDAKPSDLRMLRMLVDSGVPVNLRDSEGKTALLTAVSEYSNGIPARILLNSGADANIVDENGNSPLHAAAAAGNFDAVVELIKFGAHINVQNMDGNTPLHYAAFYCFSDIADVLLREGADPSIRNMNREKADTPNAGFHRCLLRKSEERKTRSRLSQSRPGFLKRWARSAYNKVRSILRRFFNGR